MAIDEAGVQLIAQGVAAYVADLNKADSAMTGFYGTLGKSEPAANGFQQVITGALREVGSMLVNFAADGAKALGGFIKDSIGLAGDFEAGMLNFQAVAGKAVDTKGLEQFRDLFIDLGKELPVSTSEVQQAATEMVKGGIDPATIAAGGLKQNIQFAAAAMDGDLVKAAEISSKVMGGWTAQTDSASDKAAFLTHATDLLAKAANASSTDVEGLSLGIFNAQGIAKTAGVSFDDLTTTLAELAPRFASSSEAGTSLKNLIARLQPTTDPAASAMEGLGLYTEETGSKFYDAQGNFVGFQKASELLHDSLQGLTKEQQAATLQQIFGNDAMSAAAALAELGSAGYQSMADSLANANGVTDAAALKQQGFNVALDNFHGGVEALQITLGSAFLPILADVFNYLNDTVLTAIIDFVSAITNADDPLQEIINRLDTISPILGTVVAAIADFVTSGGDLGVVADDLNDGMAGLGDAFLAVVHGAQQTIGLLQDVVSWVEQSSAASDELGGVLNDLDGIWLKLLGIVEDVGQGYLAVAQAILPQVTAFWQAHGSEITAFLETAYTKIMSIVNTALDLYDAIVPKMLHEVAGWINDHAAGIQAVLSGAWQAISGIIDGALTLIEGLLKVALDLIHGDWSKAWEDIKAMSAQFVLDLEQVIEGFLNIIAGFFNTSLQGIADVWQHNWDTLVEIAGKVADRMVEVGRNIIQGIIDGIEGAADRLFSTLKNLASDALQAAKDALGISSPSTEFAAVGQFIVDGLLQGITDGWPALTDQIGSLADGLVDQMKDIGSRMNDAIADGFGATASIDRQIAANLDKFKDVLPEYAQYTQGALKQAQDEAQAMLDPAEGAKYFKMRSQQILEYAKLQKELSEAATQEDRDRISQQMLLINQAQQAEISQFQATASAQSPMMDIADQINKVLEAISHVNLTDDQIHIVDALASIWSSLVTPTQTRADLYAHPPSSPTTTTNTTNLNMPIYTNNSPGALQNSLAVALAGLMGG